MTDTKTATNRHPRMKTEATPLHDPVELNDNQMMAVTRRTTTIRSTRTWNELAQLPRRTVMATLLEWIPQFGLAFSRRRRRAWPVRHVERSR